MMEIQNTKYNSYSLGTALTEYKQMMLQASNLVFWLWELS